MRQLVPPGQFGVGCEHDSEPSLQQLGVGQAGLVVVQSLGEGGGGRGEAT